jgi:Tol biopolymer transport system component
MAASLTEIIARRRLTGVYRRLLLLAVPAALAGCQGGGDTFAPTNEGSAPVVEAPAVEGLLASANLDRIAFGTYLSIGEADLWAINPSGTGQTRLTSFAGEESRPIWSPDHGRIAFLRMRNGKTDLFLMKADGTNKHWALATSPGYNVRMPSWAPDGKSLVAELWISPYYGYIVKIDLASGQWSHLMPLGSYGQKGMSPVYSPDGKSIYYMNTTYKELHRFQPGGQDVLVRSFTNQLSGADQVAGLALSPDGTRMAYTLFASQTSDIYVLGLGTGQVRRLTTYTGSDSQAAWSPDGSKIAFTSGRAGAPQIFTMNSVDGGNVHKVTSRLNGASQPSWYR